MSNENALLGIVCKFPALRSEENEVESKIEQAQVSIELPTTEFQSWLRDFSREQNIPVSSIFIALWGLILNTFTGNGEICMASVLGNAQLELVTTVVDEQATIIDLLQSVADGARHTGDYTSELPCNTAVYFDRKIEEIDRDLKQFEVSLVVVDADAQTEIDITLMYQTNHLAPSQAKYVAQTVSQLLKELELDAKRQISQINLLHPETERQLQTWGSHPPAVVEFCVGQLFEETVRQRPQNEAVCTADEVLTYQELDHLSGRLALHLQDLGVGPEAVVILCFPKSAWAVVAMMAVIRAGGAILFLDPSHPTARHREIADQVTTQWLLTAPEHAAQMEWLDGAVLSIDRAFVDSLGPTPEGMVLESTAISSNTLYIIFTSGSTGKPKGCVIEHRQFLTGSRAQQKASGMDSNDRVLQLASFTFDVSILEILTSLISGACVCIPDDRQRSQGPASCIQQFGITWAFLTPSLVKSMRPEQVPTLKFLVLGGEAVLEENIQVWAPHVRLANGYGPTECSIAATANVVLSIHTNPMNIGYPLGGCCWIVKPDDHDSLVPIGAPGELLIQGPIVARGYFNEPEKTQAVFLDSAKWVHADPTSSSRIYKTGDLARFNADGTIHFIGRKDNQVKLRGLRIELGEIEHRIAAHPLVRQVSVVLAKDGPCQAKLTAVVSLNELQQPSSNLELLTGEQYTAATDQLGAVAMSVSEQLPSYMLPTVWAPVWSIPLTVSGKQNGVAVRQWVQQMSIETYNGLIGKGGDLERVSPSNELEREVEALCCEILGFLQPEEVWLNKSFIQNGGDSIKATQLLDRLRRQGVAVSFEDVMQSVSLIELVQRIETQAPVNPPAHQAVREYSPSLDEKRLARVGLDINSVEDVYPLSPVQRGILLSQQQEPASYQLRITCEVLPSPGGKINQLRLLDAWQQVTARHPALRTIMVETETEDGLFDQLVLQNSNARILEWKQESENAFWKAQAEFSRTDTALQPPVVFIVSVTDDGKNFVTIDISHALVDGVSILILLRDVCLAYDGKLPTGRTIKYSSYIDYIQRLSVESSLQYWTKHLEDAIPCHIPTLNDDILIEGQPGELKMDIEGIDALYELCAAMNFTPATVFQAAWALVLQAYTGQDDVSFGYLTAGREMPVAEISEAVGVFINMMVYHMQLSPQTTIASLAKETQKSFLGGLPHQHCSVAEIQHALGRSKPLFNTIMSLQSALGEDILSGEPDGKLGFRVVAEFDPTEYDVSVNIFVSKERVSLTLRYYRAALSDAMAENVLATFCRAIYTVVHRHTSILSDLDMMSDRDHAQIARWNNHQWVDVDACVHDLISDQALARPQAIAIDAWDGSFTYQELDSITSALAKLLVQKGVEPETFVPIGFSKSRWTVVAQLATLKAGGACVAFDPEHPRSRREGIVQQCDATIAIVAEGNESLFEELVPLVIVLGANTISNLLQNQQASTLAPIVHAVSSSNPAFVVFTSGSTGKPKGIVLEHHAICSSAKAHGPAMNYGPDARVLQFASYTFDVSIGETFTCLMSGGTLCIPSEDERMNDLAGVINRMNAKVVYLTPSVVSLLHPSQVPGVHTLALGGEAVRENNITTWAERTNLVNIYGPAECSVWSTGLQGVPKSASPRNIGYGLGARMWITSVEDPGMLCSVGAVGELLIEGPIVARGYLKDDAKTRAVFISPPAWWSKYQAQEYGHDIKIYRTGDLARYNSDGSIHFIGRRDHQVKLHGQRVEMGEIDRTLLMHEKVQNALAIVPTKGRLAGKLVAVLSWNDEVHTLSKAGIELRGVSNVDTSPVRDWLATRLPAYMIPATWLIVQSIPVTKNGKSDRPSVVAWVEDLQQLDDIMAPSDSANDPESSPRNQMETDIREVISSVLNLPLSDVSMNRSFMALGGDSITAMQTSSRCRGRGIQCAVKSILKSKSLRQIAAESTILTNTGESTRTDSPAFRLLPSIHSSDLDEWVRRLGYTGLSDIEDAYPCCPMQEGILISQAQTPETYKFSAVCAIRAVDTRKPLEMNRLHMAWQRVVASHPVLRTFFVEGLSGDALYSQIVLREHTPRVETAKTLESLLRYDQENPVDYNESVPPHRMTVFEDEDALYFNLEISHTLIDGASMPLLLGDIRAAYDNEIPSGPLFSDYIAFWQRQSREATTTFWTKYLESMQPAVFPSLLDNIVPEKALRVVKMPVTNSMLSELHAFCRDNELTIANVFQAAWALVLRAYTRNVDVVFGYLSSGRDADGLDLDHAVGPFINMLPCRIQVDDSSRLVDIVRKINSDFLDSLPHQHTSLAEVQHHLRLSGERLFNTTLSLQRSMVESDERSSSIAVEYIGGSDPTEYDLGVSITVGDTVIDVDINYWTTFMSDEKASMLASTFSTILTNMLASPTKEIRALDFISEQQHEYLMALNGNGKIPATTAGCIHDEVHRQALAHPSAPAIESWDASFTYSQLDQWSNKLATKLVSIGVGAEHVVALCFDKSAWTVVAMLAVLKAGGAYTSMGPSHPRSHLARVILATKSLVILAGSKEYGSLVGDLVDHVIVVESSLFPSLPDHDLGILPTASPNSAAMINFTSGSSGKPKGIVVRHSGLRSMIAHNADMGIDRSTRVLQFSAYTFDTSNAEIFFTLCVGACICVPSEDERLTDLAGAMTRLRVDYAFLTPSLVISLLPEMLPTLKTLVLIGEAVPTDLPPKWQNHVRLLNSYGPAECSVMSSFEVLEDGVPSTSIGRGHGCLFWVTDPEDSQRLMPVGCSGELLIEGPIVTRGYLDPKLTAKSFIPPPVWRGETRSGSRLYRTGDLVRILPDGNMLFLGRADGQIKLNGQRIATWAIEEDITRHSLIHQTALVVPTEGPCKKKLVAIVVFENEVSTQDVAIDGVVPFSQDADKGKAIDQVTAIRGHLAENFPSYMMPSVWLLCSRLPLTASRKLDRLTVKSWVESMDQQTYFDALAEREQQIDPTESDIPTSNAAERLQRIIGRVLNLPLSQVSLQRSFFNLGGDSITAMQLVVTCRNEGIKLLFKDVMRSASISALADGVQMVDHINVHQHRDQLDTPFDLTPIQQLYFQSISQGSHDASANQFNQSFLFRLTSDVPVEQLRAAVDKVVQRHSMLRARFRQSHNGQWKQILIGHSAMAYRFRHHAVGNEQEALDVAQQAQEELDIQNGPVFGVELFSITDQSPMLFLVAHHLVIDLVSWRIIFQELQDSIDGQVSQAPTPPFSFQQWQQLQTEYAAEHLPPSQALPYTIPPADYVYWGMEDVPNFAGDTIQISAVLEPRESEALLTGCHQAMRTEPLDILVAALFASFAETFQRTPPAIFNEGHGRQPWTSDIDLSDSVGWFTTVFPFFLSGLEPNTPSKEIARGVKDQRRTLPANGWSYFTSRYLNESSVKAFADHMPVEILFNYLGLYQGLERAEGIFQLVPFNKGDVGSAVRRYALFEINVYVINGSTHISFTFNRHMKHVDRIEKWLENFTTSLKDMSQSLAVADFTLTRSDYPLLNISYPDLDRLQNSRIPQLGLTLDDIEDLYPCSPLQTGILLSQIRLEDAYLYHAIMRMDSCAGVSLNAKQLAAAWQQVVDRHTILRTVFLKGITQQPFDQMVLRSHRAVSPILTAESNSQALDLLKRYEPLVPSIIEPPHRLVVVQCAEGPVFFRLDMSHALLDGTAMSVLINDLASAYGNQISASPAIPYSDYIAYIQSQPAADGLEFWSDHLADVKPCHFPSLLLSSEPEPEMKTIDVTVPDHWEVRSFCQENNITLANVIRLAWSLVLAAYTGEEHVCFGYLTAGREVPLPGVENAVGPFINMLVCATNLGQISQKPVVTELQDLHDEYLKMLPYQHVGLAEIQHALGVTGQSLFNTVVSFQRRDVGMLVLDDLQLTYLDGCDPTEYDISVNVADTDHGFTVDLGYLTSRLSPEYAVHVAGALSAALTSIVSRTSSTVGSVDIFDSAAQKQILDWNSSMPPVVNETLQSLFQRHVSACPDAPAIASWDGHMTYAQLDEKSSQLAHLLVNMGIGSDNLVPICFEKSAWAIVSMLAVLKAGAGFVPLDPSSPCNRLELIIQQTASSLVLASEEKMALVVDLVPKVLVVSASASIWDEDAHVLNGSVSPLSVAYVLFTSGSTGTPKGVVMEHAGVSTSVIHHGKEIGCSAATRMFQFAAFTFDACILEIFTTLAYGGCICLPSDAERMSDISGSMTRLDANTSFLTPSVVRLLRPEQVPTLKTLILGGEALHEDNIQTWSESLRLMNGYGPTETCVFCVMKTFAGKNDRCDVLGRAVSSVAWITRPNNHEQLAPVGAIGELLVQGSTLARGYLHDQTKTDQVFVSNPAFYSTPENSIERFYKTGDLVRYNIDGTITYLGRRDTQIKLRGQRIELSEIEHQINRHLPSNTQIAVEVVLPHGDQEQALLAVFVFKPVRLAGSELLGEVTADTRALALDLKAHLARVLPPYMQPSLYVPTNWTPTTSAQKLDRKSLRDAVTKLSDGQLKGYSLREDGRRVPHTVSEKKVQELWHRILKISLDEIRSEDNFFQMGGDSIAAMKMAATTGEDFPITVMDIFQYPVLSELAAVMANKGFANDNDPISLEPFGLLDNIPEISSLVDTISHEYSIPSESIEDVYPSSPLQEGMMALSMLNPKSYILRRVLRLGPALDIARFQSAWELAAQKNPIMRTRFVPTPNAGLVQVVVKDTIDWRRAADLEQYLERDMAEAMVYGAPPVRYGLTEDGYFIWTAHHAVYDGWSLPLILNQVQSAYEYDHCPESTSFNTFIKYLQTTDAQLTRSFWEERLSGPRASTFPELPSPSYRASVRGRVQHEIHVRHLADSTILRTTILRAAWGLLLSRYADSENIVFGMTLSGRNGPVSGIDAMIGPTITTVPVRMNIAPALTINEFLAQVQQQSTEMIPHEHFGLQNIAGISSDCARGIEFQNLFVIQPVSDATATGDLLPGVEEIELPLEDFDSYPLIVECFVADDKITIEIRHDDDVLSAWQVQTMMYHFEHLLEQLTETKNQEAQVASVDLFGPHDLQQIIQWNEQYPEVVESTVPVIFAGQVSGQPDALAVDAWDGRLTYSELDSVSTTLARHLVSLGVVPEALVPMCFDKSRWAVVAQLAVMKAGGACVNLDPAHPQSRLETIVKDAQATVLLTNPRHADVLGTSTGLQTVLVTEDFISTLKDLTQQLPTISPRNAAYVLFTSGSTGKPKGIVIEHRSLCSSSKAHGTRWGIGPGTRLLQFAAYTFDVSCADIFTTLQRGGCICVPSEEQRLNDLSGAINTFQCNWAFLTPTIAALLPADNLPSLRTLVLGGEASTRDTIAKWHNVLDLIVCYGPAECSVYCSGAPPAIATSDPANLGASIGSIYWIAHPQDSNRLTPLGCVGELLLQGPTVARGYLHDAEKTAQAFVSNPVWAPVPGSRFYRTGDLVRYNEDGTIRFVGRKDNQVKVRGQRVELGEIEHAIRLAMPTLAHATVDAMQDPNHPRQIVVAFLHYSNRSGPAKLVDMSVKLQEELVTLQQTLGQHLPSYMIPSMFIPLSRVPLTMNGKADRRQLRELATSLSQEDSLAFSLANSVKQEPTTPMEVQLRELWAKVLQAEKHTLGKNDHFLRCGGDSIIAMKLASHARSAGFNLTVQDIFQTPVLEEMAALISQKSLQILAPQSDVPYTPFSLIGDISLSDLLPSTALSTSTHLENIADVLPASDFQASAISHSMMKSHGLVNYLFLDGEGQVPWDLAFIQEAWTVFLQAHQILRTVFAAHGDCFYQVVLKDVSQPIGWYKVEEEIEPFSHLLCKEDVNKDLPLGSLLTQLAVVSNQKQHRLILRVSHAQYDGVCLPRVWQSFQEVLSGRTPAPEVPFSHFIANIHPPGPDSQTYWRDFLSNSSMTTIIAQSKPQYQNVYDLHLTRTISVTSQSSSGITFATILKTAWALVLSSLSDSADVVFGHVVSGRNIPQLNIEQVIGPCLNILPTRVKIDPTGSINDLLDSVQAQHTAHMAHESLGTRNIVRSCSPWQPSTRMSSIVQHQNIDQDATVTLDNQKYLVGDFCPAADEADIAIKTTPLDNNQMEVLLITSSRSVGESMAATLLDRLCITIQAICDSTDPQVAVSQLIHSEAVLPLPSPGVLHEDSAVGRIDDIPSLDADKLSAIYASWREVLAQPELPLDLESDFFAVGGDLVSIALLTAFWQRQGYQVAVEDLWDHSQVRGMLDILTRASV
ncbi:HC-toxin synthetase [Penicillium vulpinum]|uniref:Carrier domain-containing protein n=1 Tax=Penicillium vulpinum TaxID=29845 RepID=A0A1V6SCU2_9EURO|nr:HC-toxin synthetase [Penicillium vulpinum]KAJ5964403.1 HC-toxin synthetase [Penicillium vulpinum]OQE11728.1 hypothetical protein PENVUL_c002G00953 [Penicillium vulpinum]